jgi:hypothetical protein
MIWQNLYLSDDAIRVNLQKLEVLNKGSIYEQTAVGVFMAESLRKAFGLSCTEATEDLNALCKSETQTAFPNLTEEELKAFVKSRNTAIQALTDTIAQDSLSLIKSFTEGTIQKGTENFTEKLNTLFSDANIDDLIVKKVQALNPSIVTAIIEKTRFKFYEVKQ